MGIVQRIGDLRQCRQPIGHGLQLGHRATVDQFHCEPTGPALIHLDDVRVVEPVGEVEFALQPRHLGRLAVMVVENLQRHHAIRVGGVVRPVHRRVPAVAEGRVDDVALEPVAG